MDDWKRMTTMLYGVMLLMLLAAIGCTKHLILFKQWYTLTFAGIEDIAIIVLIAWLLPYRRPDHDLSVRHLAQIALLGVLFIGTISEIGMGLLR